MSRAIVKRLAAQRIVDGGCVVRCPFPLRALVLGGAPVARTAPAS